MKLVIDRGELLRGLGHVTSVVEKRTTMTEELVPC